MKGFLQRLAVSSSRAEGGVRPFVGSIFASSLREPGVQNVRPAPAEQTTEMMAREPTVRITSAETMRPRHEGGPLESPRAALSEIAARARSSLLLPDHATRAEAPETEVHLSQVQEDSFESRRQPHLQRDGTTRTQEQEELPLDKQPESQPVVLRPLVVGERTEERGLIGAALGAPMREQLRVAETQRSRDKSQDRVAAARASERDAFEDIQIHIGRIEVIAVPPPAPRATPAPARKSTSLDDYLKRRNGRAG
jgi:hypothetical protein